MSYTAATEPTRAGLTFNPEVFLNFNDLKGVVKLALEAFGLNTCEETEAVDDRMALTFGPVMVVLECQPYDAQSLDIRVSRLRESEVLHPEAETAILAEILSVLSEQIGNGTLDWSEDGVVLPLERFAAAFTPLRRRGGGTRVCPRRVRPGETAGTPIIFHTPTPKAPITDDEDRATLEQLKQLFTEAEEETPDTGLSSVSAWAATATVGVMNPLVGVPLAAYNLAKGADLRVSTHAFAITATLSGLIGTSFGHLPFF